MSDKERAAEIRREWVDEFTRLPSVTALPDAERRNWIANYLARLKRIPATEIIEAYAVRPGPADGG